MNLLTQAIKRFEPITVKTFYVFVYSSLYTLKSFRRFTCSLDSLQCRFTSFEHLWIDIKIHLLQDCITVTHDGHTRKGIRNLS